MTRKRHIFDSPRVVDSSPPPIGAPTVNFQSTELVALVGDDVSMAIFWGSISDGLAVLTTTVAGLGDVSDLNLPSGNATWSKSNVQLVDSGQVQVDISDAGGASLDAFNLIVRAAPTVTVADDDVDVVTGETGLNAISWTNPDGSAQNPVEITTNFGVVDQISDTSLTSGTARWINANSQINDSHAVTIFVEDANGLAGTDLFVFTVTPSPTGAPVVITDPQFSVELPIGSEAVLNFTVQDSETSGAKPMALFQILDPADVSGDGVFSPLPGAVTVPTTVSVAWSTVAQHLINDGDILTIRATDDDANTGEASTEVFYGVIDPLKTLPAHQVQRVSAWQVEQVEP